MRLHRFIGVAYQFVQKLKINSIFFVFSINHFEVWFWSFSEPTNIAQKMMILQIENDNTLPNFKRLKMGFSTLEISVCQAGPRISFEHKKVFGLPNPKKQRSVKLNTRLHTSKLLTTQEPDQLAIRIRSSLWFKFLCFPKQ